MANIPLNGRSFQDLISTTPGVVTQSPQAATQYPGYVGDFSINGQRTQSNYYTVDGVTANISAGNGAGSAQSATGGTLGATTALGTTQSIISVDALEEFRVQSSTYSAEYGHSPGGQFSLVTRSGTNIFHGGIFDYLRNNYFDANNWFNDHYGSATPAERQNDFGGTLGGPLSVPRIYSGRNRTFFFASYEGLRLDQPTAASIKYVPDMFMRQQATPAMQPILNAFPIPNGVDYGSSSAPSLAQFIESYSLPSQIDSTSIRFDHLISPKVSVFFRLGDSPTSTASRPNFALLKTVLNAQTYTVGVTAQINNNLSDELRVGYARSSSSLVETLDNFAGSTPINLGSALGTSVTNPYSYIYLSFSGIGSSPLAVENAGDKGRQWNLVDSLNLRHNDQQFKFGVDYRRIESPINPASLEILSEFLSAKTVLSGAPEVPEFVSSKSVTPIFNELALFAQDEWRVMPRLNLSLGLRWEVNPPPTEQHGDDAYTLNGSIADPSSLTVAPQGTALWKTPWYNFSPRLGTAWIAHEGRGVQTVVRGGGGVFFDTSNEIAALGYTALGFQAYQIKSGATIPYTQAELTVPISTTPPYTTSTVIAFPDHLQLPYTFEWNASVEQGFGKSQALTISYVGSNGRRLTGLQYLSLAKINPNFGIVKYFDCDLTSNYQSLQVQFQRSIAHGLQALASYTWSHAIDFGSSSVAFPLTRGNADFDVRNNFQASLTWDLPAMRGRLLAGALLNGWGVDGRVNIHTSFPVTLSGNSIINPVTGSETSSGLNLVAGQPLYIYGSQYPGSRAINKAAFALPSGSTAGNAPRNFVRGFGESQANLAIRRTFPLRDQIALMFRAETFNVLNHPNFGYVDPTFTDATFGQATQTLNSSLGTMSSLYQQGGPRSMQFALKLVY